MLRRNHLAAIFALAVSFSATLTLSAFGDPFPGLCPAANGAIEPDMTIDEYFEDPMTGWFAYFLHAGYVINCANTPNATGSCCGYCTIACVYYWDDVVDEYVLGAASTITQSNFKECGSLTLNHNITGHFEGPDFTRDLKYVIKFALYDCSPDPNDMNLCCKGCQNPTWSTNSTFYHGFVHE